MGRIDTLSRFYYQDTWGQAYEVHAFYDRGSAYGRPRGYYVSISRVEVEGCGDGIVSMRYSSLQEDPTYLVEEVRRCSGAAAKRCRARVGELVNGYFEERGLVARLCLDGLSELVRR